jgi:hypothetical protein
MAYPIGGIEVIRVLPTCISEFRLGQLYSTSSNPNLDQDNLVPGNLNQSKVIELDLQFNVLCLHPSGHAIHIRIRIHEIHTEVISILAIPSAKLFYIARTLISPGDRHGFHNYPRQASHIIR